MPGAAILALSGSSTSAANSTRQCLRHPRLVLRHRLPCTWQRRCEPW